MSVPCYGDSHDSVFEDTGKILRLCAALNIDTVAGPVTSGVVIAMACFMRSRTWKKPVKALLLGKQGYCRDKHGCGPKRMGYGDIQRILVADDCVDTGAALIDALEEIRQSTRLRYENAKVVGCVSNVINDIAAERIWNAFPGVRLFDMWKGKAEEVIS